MERSQPIFHIILLLATMGVYLASSAYLGYEESIDAPSLPPAPLGLSQSPDDGSDDAGKVPTSRPTDYTKAEKTTIVTTHNRLRKRVTPPAANMRALEWDRDLAAMAQGWSDQCIFAHGNPETSSPFDSVGQNLYIRHTSQTNPAAPDPTVPITKWNDEGDRYTLADRSCSGEKTCGHYTQVVWAKTTHVGCGQTFCETATNGKGKTYKNAWIVTCNYGPSGNYKGQHPYLEGDRCSKCSNPSTCKGGLCRECELGSKGCSCDLVCENCGHQNTADGVCECSCPRGFLGNNCQKTCENTDRRCGASPGWPNKRFCKRSPMIPSKCPLMCGLCERADEDYVCNQGNATLT